MVLQTLLVHAQTFQLQMFTLGAKEMAWIMDTYSALKGNYVQPEIITGKPIAIGGSLGRTEAQAEDWRSQ